MGKGGWATPSSALNLVLELPNAVPRIEPISATWKAKT